MGYREQMAESLPLLAYAVRPDEVESRGSLKPTHRRHRACP